MKANKKCLIIIISGIAVILCGCISLTAIFVWWPNGHKEIGIEPSTTTSTKPQEDTNTEKSLEGQAGKLDETRKTELEKIIQNDLSKIKQKYEKVPEFISILEEKASVELVKEKKESNEKITLIAEVTAPDLLEAYAFLYHRKVLFEPFPMI